MQHHLDAHETAIAGHDLDGDDAYRTMQMLVWYVVTPGAIAGTLIFLWALWQAYRWIAG